MAQNVTDILHHHNLRWKPDSLQFLTPLTTPQKFVLVVDAQEELESVTRSIDLKSIYRKSPASMLGVPFSYNSNAKDGRKPFDKLLNAEQLDEFKKILVSVSTRHTNRTVM